MTSESILVAAAFPEPSNAEAAVKELGEKGFGQGDVSLMYTDKGNVVKEGLLQGVVFGGVIGGLVGLLFPPAGLIVAAGPILGTVASALTSAAGVAVVGGALYALTDLLVQIGMPKEMADKYGAHIHKGDALVIVHTIREQSDAAKAILAAHDPREADEHGEAVEVMTAATPAKQAPAS
jgi:hypothetical protein